MDTTILVAIVSASSVLVGVIAAQGVAMLQSWLDRKHKREILLREKYEALGLHFLDSMKLPHELMGATSAEAVLALTRQESANKAQMLALVYFPKLRQPIGQYSDSYSALCLAATSLYNPEDKRRLGAQVFDKPQYIDARNAHLAARDHLQDQIEMHSVIYAKS
jgi:hypothetical protein